MSQYLIARYKNKYVLFTAVILFAYSAVFYFFPDALSLTAWNKAPDFAEANYSGFYSIYAITFLVVPLFYIYGQPNRFFFENESTLFRFSKFKNYIGFRTFTLFAESAFFVLFLYFLIFLRSVVFHQQNQFLFMVPQYLGFAFLQTLGFSFLGVIFCFVSSLVHNALAGAVCSYAFVVYDYICSSTGNENWVQFVGRSIALQPNDFHRYFFMVIETLLINAALVGFAYFLLGEKDCLPKKRH